MGRRNRHRATPSGQPLTRRALLVSGLGLVTVAGATGIVTTRWRHGGAVDVRDLSGGAASPTFGSVPSLTASPSPSPSPTPSPTPSERVAEAFSLAAADYMSGRRGQAAVAGVNLTTGQRVDHRPDGQFRTASIVKVEILETLMLTLQKRGDWPSSRQRSLARSMITRSDNDAANALWSTIGGASGLKGMNTTLGMTDSVPGTGGYWGATLTTAPDQLRVLMALVDPDSPLDEEYRDYVRDLMYATVDEQRWGTPEAGKAGTAAVKNGWLPAQSDGGLWTINSLGLVFLANGQRVALAVLSRRSPSMAVGITTVEHLAALAGRALSGVVLSDSTPSFGAPSSGASSAGASGVSSTSHT